MKYKIEMDCRIETEVIADNEEEAISLAKRVSSQKKFYWKGEAKVSQMESVEAKPIISKITADLEKAREGMRLCNQCGKYKPANTFKKDNYKNMICKGCQ